MSIYPREKRIVVTFYFVVLVKHSKEMLRSLILLLLIILIEPHFLIEGIASQSKDKPIQVCASSRILCPLRELSGCALVWLDGRLWTVVLTRGFPEEGSPGLACSSAGHGGNSLRVHTGHRKLSLRLAEEAWSGGSQELRLP